jgi:uncharacterized protein (DUF302 family)
MITTRSQFGQAETLTRLIAAVQERGMTVFAHIDHAAGARAVGMELADEDVLLFGNPRAGTLLMQSDPQIGVELPLRILVWTEPDGVMLAYHDPRELAKRFDLVTQRSLLDSMVSLLGEVASTAAGSG